MSAVHKFFHTTYFVVNKVCVHVTSEYSRTQIGLPELSEEVVGADANDGCRRRTTCVTLTPATAAAAAAAAAAGPALQC